MAWTWATALAILMVATGAQAGEADMTGKTWQGTNATLAAEALVIARNEGQWRDLWRLTGEAAPGPLGDAMAVAVFAGRHMTGGYQVEIAGIDRDDAGCTVDYRVDGPPPGAMVTQMITSPWAVRTLPSCPGPVVFRPGR